MSTLERSPRSLTREEQDSLLRTTLDHPRGFRDHLIYALALGTGLREHEIAALNVGQVLAPDGRIRGQMTLTVFKRSSHHPGPQEVFLPDALRSKLARFIEWKRKRGEELAPDSPLFLSQWGRRISLRMLRWTFRRWQERAGFDRRFGFHGLRHAALQNAYRATRDIRLVQRLARHKSVLTTTIYAAPSDEDLIQAVRGLPC